MITSIAEESFGEMEAAANLRRQSDGKRALLLYASHISTANYGDDIETIATDCVADICHYLGTIPTANPATVLDRALNHYMDEV